MKIKGLLEPAHSCYGLGLHFLDLLNIGTVEFGMWTFKTFGMNFLLFLGSCVIRKFVHSSWWELEKSLGWRWDGQRSLGRLRPQLAAIYLITLTATVIIFNESSDCFQVQGLLITILWKTKVVLLFHCESSHACQSLALLVETKTKKINYFKIIIGFLFHSTTILSNKGRHFVCL